MTATLKAGKLTAENIKEAFHEFLRDDAPLNWKMTWKPDLTARLLDRITAFRLVEEPSTAEGGRLIGVDEAKGESRSVTTHWEADDGPVLVEEVSTPTPDRKDDLEPVAWRDGAPPKPWSEEWFIAETTFGDRVVLRALPDDYSYDFKTADETYIKRDRIKRWMRFPDAHFIEPEWADAKARIEGLEGEIAELLSRMDADATTIDILSGQRDAAVKALERAADDLRDIGGQSPKPSNSPDPDHENYLRLVLISLAQTGNTRARQALSAIKGEAG